RRTVVYKRGNFAEKVPFSATFEGRKITLWPADLAPKVVAGSSFGVIMHPLIGVANPTCRFSGKSATSTIADCSLSQTGHKGPGCEQPNTKHQSPMALI
ncbi:MAG: hypothetical protein ACP5XB_22900, partial [Isosphaeraceae bacterium]